MGESCMEPGVWLESWEDTICWVENSGREEIGFGEGNIV